MAKFSLYLPEQICLKAVEGELTLPEATEAFLDAVSDEDYLEFACPNAEVLFESPDESERGEHEARLMAFFVAMLDDFTAPQPPFAPPTRYAIPRSTPDC